LRGAVQTYFHEISNEVLKLTTWNEWVQAFSTQFPDNQHIDFKRDQLVARFQKPGKNVLQFASDIRYLARRAQPRWTGQGKMIF